MITKFNEMTQTGRDFVLYLLNQRLEFWTKNGHCTIEANENEIEICCEKTMNGGVVEDAMKVADVWGFSSYIYCEMCQIRLKIY